MKSRFLLLLTFLFIGSAHFYVLANPPSANTGSKDANKSKTAVLQDITYSCSNDYVKAESIKILWSEVNYSLPISVLDGFNMDTCIGKASKNTFIWDRGTSQASLDRRTGALTIKPKKYGVTISLNCKVID